MPSKFNEFWRTIEGYQHHAALPITWRRVLGREYESLRKMLVPTKEYGASYPSPYGKNAPEWEIVELPNGSFVAVNNFDDDPIKLEPSEAYLHKLHVRKFCKTLVELLEVEATNEIDSDSVIRLGNIRIAKNEYPVILMLVPGRRYFYDEVSRLLLTNPQPFIIMTGTRVVWDHELADVLKQRNVQLLALDDITSIENGKFVPTPVWSGAVEAFRLVVCPENLVSLPPYEFRKKGEMWVVRYEGKEAYLKDSVGAKYLSQLFSRPNHAIYAVDLQLIGAGHDPGTAPPPDAGLELGDMRTVQEIEAKSRELLADLDKARSEGDTLCENEILTEIDELSDYLCQIKGLGGRLRKEKDSADSIRIAVQRGIKRAVEAVEDDLPEFAKHCRQSISYGFAVVYDPTKQVDWDV